MRKYAVRTSRAMLDLHEVTSVLDDAEMQTSPEQLQFLSFLANSIGTKQAIEVGVYTGASALAIAEVLPKDGTLDALELSDENLETARQAWTAGGVLDRIKVRIGPAMQTLTSMLDEPLAGTDDFMYIDADKVNNKGYYELGLQLVRSGGIIAIDNMFYSGMVADPSCNDESTIAIRELAALMLTDNRIDYSLVPIGDGLAIARIRD